LYDVYKIKDNQVAIDAFNKVFNTSYTLKDIDKTDLINEVNNDMKLGNVVKLSGTPTILFN